MEVRHQVFISSTFEDLIDARQAVSTALLRADCLPSGMELFPASDQSQFEFIKSVIDECDYYLLILAGRYGTIDPKTGLSFTEMEYDYAVSKKKPIVRLLQQDPILTLPAESLEKTDAGRASLHRFREKVRNGILVKFWKDVSELQFETVMGLQQAKQSHPQPGWVRGGAKQAEVAALENKIADLEKELENYQATETALPLDHLKMCLERRESFTDGLEMNDLLFLTAQCLGQNVVFVDEFKRALSELCLTETMPDTLVEALILDRVIKIRKTGEVIVLPDGQRLLSKVRFMRAV
ncbi:MAG: hypothetical protein BM560_07165 [Roseobacter sp. MedPE-SWde]|nr:MAG: hypothetical protein BM560_07165 [Roseobacter sp. MedPE-SWde]